MMKWLVRIGAVLAVVLALIQGYRPERTNPPVDSSRTLHAHVDVPPAVDAILDRACNDCHSNDTHWPWYSNVAPVSWMVVKDANEGREHLNFSEWASFQPDDARHALKEICEEVQKGAMPMKEYTWTHRDARLSQSDISTLCGWTREFSDRRRRAG